MEEVFVVYTINKNMLKTLIKLPDWRKQPIIAELCVVYGYYFFSLPIQDPYNILHILQETHIQPVSRLQLLLSNAH